MFAASSDASQYQADQRNQKHRKGLRFEPESKERERDEQGNPQTRHTNILVRLKNFFSAPSERGGLWEYLDVI